MIDLQCFNLFVLKVIFLFKSKKVKSKTVHTVLLILFIKLF